MFDQKEDDRGYYYYVNRYNSVQQNDNPNLVYIINKINEKFAASKYSTYRTSSKLFALQKSLLTSYIPFSTICAIIDRHRLNQVDKIKPFQLTALINDIFFASERLGYFTDVLIPDLEASCAILASFFWAVFDVKRITSISLLELKLTFLILSDSKSFDQIIFEHFYLACDHNNCVSRHRFESMLQILSKILAFFDESEILRHGTISEIVHECFVKCPGLVGLNEYQFNCLWKLSNKFSYYSNILALNKRIRDSEFVLHNVQCAGCRLTIQGLRFTCHKCGHFSLCIGCFTTGFTTKKHNIGHKMYEICSNELPKSRWARFCSKFCSFFKSKKMPHQSTYDNMKSNLIDTNSVELLDVNQPTNEVYERGTIKSTAQRTSSVRKSKNKSLFSLNAESTVFTGAVNQNSVILDKILAVIEQMEADKDKFGQNLIKLKSLTIDNPEIYGYFELHGKLLENNIDKLKEIGRNTHKHHPQSSSTPYRSSNKMKKSFNIHQSSFIKSINGAEINKSYLEETNSDISMRDISSWYYQKGENEENDELSIKLDNLKIDTHMTNFKDLITKVREIVDDSYSDNTELAKTTALLETELDQIIQQEESKRIQKETSPLV